MRIWHAIVFVVFVSACTANRAAPVNCYAFTEAADRNPCLFNQSVQRLDIGSCEDITDEKLKEECINGIAISLLDYTPCKRHDRMSKRDACERMVGEAKRKAKEGKNAGIT